MRQRNVILLFFGAFLAIALALMMLVRTPPTEVASKNADLIEALLPSVE
jgi:hypothetical protein